MQSCRDDKKKIIIIGASDLQNPLILKAKALGFETHVFAWQDGSVGEETADFFYPISITEKEKILAEAIEIKPHAVLTIASDLAQITVNYVANELGLTANPEHTTQACTNKFVMREALQNAGIPTPKHYKVDINTDLSLFSNAIFPLIVKPTDRSGSRGITKVDTSEALMFAIKNAAEQSFEKKAIVEEFISGEEFSCEGISYRGEHHVLAFTKKYTTDDPNYIEIGHLQPVNIDKEIQQKAKALIVKALDALGIQNGASHSEFKIDDHGNIGIIEIGARMGGDCIGSDLVFLSTGYDYLKMIIDIALGNPPDFVKNNNLRTALVWFILNERDFELLNRIKREYPEVLYFASKITKDFHNPVVSSATRHGYFILACKDKEQLDRIMLWSNND